MQQTFSKKSSTDNDRQQEVIFKICPMCGKKWPTIKDFFSDPDLIYTGYQANTGVLDYGIFYFTHNHRNCGSTMGLEAGILYSLLCKKQPQPDKNLPLHFSSVEVSAEKRVFSFGPQAQYAAF